MYLASRAFARKDPAIEHHLIFNRSSRQQHAHTFQFGYSCCEVATCFEHLCTPWLPLATMTKLQAQASCILDFRAAAVQICRSLCMQAVSHAGILKRYLRTADFVRCSRSMPPDNTLFFISCPVMFEDLEQYQDVIVALAQLNSVCDWIAFCSAMQTIVLMCTIWCVMDGMLYTQVSFRYHLFGKFFTTWTQSVMPAFQRGKRNVCAGSGVLMILTCNLELAITVLCVCVVSV